MLLLLRRALLSRLATVPVDAGPGLPGAPGRPVVHPERWAGDRTPAAVCPTGALTVGRDPVSGHEIATLSYAACVFCGRCAEASSDRTVEMVPEVAWSAPTRAALVTTYDLTLGRVLEKSSVGREAELTGEALRRFAQHRFGRAVTVYPVNTGSCNGCELEIAALTSPLYDLERFGIEVAGSPRQADVLLVTGPVTHALKPALQRAADAMPGRRAVVAVGACGCSGGVFRGAYGVAAGVDSAVPVDVYVPGCPPPPEVLLHGILIATARLTQPPATSPQTRSSPA